MATGSEISAVFCAAALMTPRPPFSQYSRADETALFVTQYSVMSSSTSSFVGDSSGSSPYVPCAKPGCTRTRWIRERPDDLDELEHRARPTVRNDQSSSAN